MDLKERIFRKNISQSKLAQLLGMSRTHLGEIIRGRRKLTPTIAQCIEEILGEQNSKTKINGLKEYLFLKKIPQSEFAKQLGISRPHLTQILSGRYIPSVKLAIKIEELTGGKVSKEDLVFPKS